jgi:hypothetical protein
MSTSSLLLASDVVDIYHDKANAWLYLDWKGPQELALVQQACGQLIGLIQQTGVHKALNDNTHITQTSWELVKWVAYDYLPLAGQAGLDYVAWVQSPLLACRSDLNLMSDLMGRTPQVALFDDLAGACDWLASANMAVL